MKKTEYIAPEMEVVVLKMENLMQAVSGDGGGSNPGDDIISGGDGPIDD